MATSLDMGAESNNLKASKNAGLGSVKVGSGSRGPRDEEGHGCKRGVMTTYLLHHYYEDAALPGGKLVGTDVTGH